MVIYLLDLTGTFMFALTGAYFGLQQKFNLLGIILFASITAVGGGTIRELLLQRTPFYFHDYLYLFAILAAILFVLATYKKLTPTSPIVLILEALGTTIFAFNGAYAAVTAHLGLPVIILFASLTAFGGGLLCDIIARQRPRIFYSGACVIPSLLLGGLCWLVSESLNNLFVVGIVLACTYFTQLCFIYRPQVLSIGYKTMGLIFKQQSKSTVPKI